MGSAVAAGNVRAGDGRESNASFLVSFAVSRLSDTLAVGVCPRSRGVQPNQSMRGGPYNETSCDTHDLCDRTHSEHGRSWSH
jgi:hypothetical protein